MSGTSRLQRAKGGGTSRLRMKASGNPDVFKEAEGKEEYAKRGGRMGKKHRKEGGRLVQFMAGGTVKPRMDKAPRGRRRGGGVGADTSPLTSAYRVSSAEKMPKEQDGGASPE